MVPVKYSVLLSIVLLISFKDVKANAHTCGIYSYKALNQIEFCKKPIQDTTELDTSRRVFATVDTYPQYPGGEASLLSDLSKNTKYPKKAKKNNIQGRVTINFVVEKDGSISNLRVLRGFELGGGLAEASIEAVKKLKAFSPGLLNGKPVRVSFSVPLTFSLN